jgi:hypothetical protein
MLEPDNTHLKRTIQTHVKYLSSFVNVLFKLSRLSSGVKQLIGHRFSVASAQGEVKLWHFKALLPKITAK